MILSPSSKSRIVWEISVYSSKHNIGLIVENNKTGAETELYMTRGMQ